MSDMFLPNLTEKESTDKNIDAWIEFNGPVIIGNTTCMLYATYGPIASHDDLYGFYIPDGYTYGLTQEDIDNEITIEQAASEGWLEP